MSRSSLILILFLLFVGTIAAQTTVFTYQGRFVDSTLPQPTNGNYEMQYRLYDTATVGTGTLIDTQTITSVPVASGIFTVQLDYGATVFRGTDVFIEIGVRPTGSAQPFTTLSPRQAITAVPVAIRSRVTNLADLASNSNALGGQPASDYVQITDTRLADDRDPTVGSPAYIQNQTALSQPANFNIGGNGVVAGNLGVGGAITGNGANISSLNAGNVSTGTLLPTRGGTGVNVTGASGNFLRSNGSLWTSSPFLAADIPTGSGNYVQNATQQQSASNFNISGNGTVGGTLSANAVNSTTLFKIAGVNVFSTPNGSSVVVGGDTSNHTLAGIESTFVGNLAGQFSNNLSQGNTFIGYTAGRENTSGKDNTMVGRGAGFFTSGVSFNSIFGSQAGSNNKVDGSSFFGYDAGTLNSTGLRNSFFGFRAGEGNQVDNDNSFFGYKAGNNNFSGSGNSFFGSSAGVVNTNGDQNAFFGSSSGPVNNNGSQNAFFGESSGLINTSGSNNTFVGYRAGFTTSTDSFNTAIGSQSIAVLGTGNTAVGSGAISAGGFNTTVGYNSFSSGTDNTIIGSNVLIQGAIPVIHSTAIGTDATVTTSNTVMLGSNIDTVKVPKDIVTAGTAKSNVVQVMGNMVLTYLLPPINGEFTLCINQTGFVYRCGFFGSKNISSLPSGNESKQNGVPASGEPGPVTSIKDQQTQIDAQGEQIKRQQVQIDALRQIVCSANPTVEMCRK